MNLGRPADPGLAPTLPSASLSCGWGPSHAASACPGSAGSSRRRADSRMQNHSPIPPLPQAPHTPSQASTSHSFMLRHRGPQRQPQSTSKLILSTPPPIAQLGALQGCPLLSERSPRSPVWLAKHSGEAAPGRAPAHPPPHPPVGVPPPPGHCRASPAPSSGGPHVRKSDLTHENVCLK